MFRPGTDSMPCLATSRDHAIRVNDHYGVVFASKAPTRTTCDARSWRTETAACCDECPAGPR